MCTFETVENLGLREDQVQHARILKSSVSDSIGSVSVNAQHDYVKVWMGFFFLFFSFILTYFNLRNLNEFVY